ncbi:MarR family winged helix-turn-helix transcriptional regulator [Paenirhodobacter sp.]|uniref:MarR family winged helix-turn-helix transcriptional regulator n=1 Tax=Paenirhodobacter sp. TaxID=1965326 RepID=UPI003B426735
MTRALSPADMICYSIYSANHALTRTYRGLLDPLGLTYPQYLVLTVLWAAPEPLAVKTIGAQLRLDSGTLTPLVKRLEAGGYVSRARNPRDERETLVSLTDAGRALEARAAHVPDAIMKATGLTLDGLADLRDRISALRERLDER